MDNLAALYPGYFGEINEVIVTDCYLLISSLPLLLFKASLQWPKAKLLKILGIKSQPF